MTTEFAKITKPTNDKFAIITTVADQIMAKYNLIHIRETGEFLLYDGRKYSEAAAERQVLEWTEKTIAGCSSYDRHEVLNKIKARVGKSITEFDQDPHLITISSGIVDLRTMEQKPHSPEHLSRTVMPVSFVKTDEPKNMEELRTRLSHTRFYKYLESCFTIDGKTDYTSIDLLLEIMASFFCKQIIDEKAYMFIGSGANGKSVMLDYIASMIGNENISRVMLQDLQNDRFMRAELDGKLANIFSDLGANDLKETGIIKQIVTGEPIQSQRKHAQPFTMHPFAKLIFSCNQFPRVADQTPAWFRRWILVEWKRSFKNDPTKDETLKDKLTADQAEKDYVFSNLLWLTARLSKTRKFTKCPTETETKLLWNQKSEPIQAFVEKATVRVEGCTRPDFEVYQHYRKFATMRGDVILGPRQFHTELESKYYEFDRQYNKDTHGNRKLWLDIDLVPLDKIGDLDQFMEDHQ